MKDSQQKQVSFSIIPEQQRTIQVKTDEHILKKYTDLIGIKGKEDLVKMENGLHSLFTGFIHYDQYLDFHQQMSVKITRKTKNFEFINVQVRIGHFIFPKISILNIKVKSPHHNQTQLIGSGSFSSVYQCKCQNKEIAIKCFPIDNNEQTLENKLRMVLQEYCILTIASLLKVGPKVLNIFGYNIMIYSHCIEIGMELCQKLQQNHIRKYLRRIKQDQRSNLIRLHALKIIHFDIKIENIAFSPTFNKYVFLDFGLSKIIKEQLGLKSLTTYGGTYANSSPEMTALFNSKQESFVDLYYNDIHCLQAVFSQFLMIKNGFYQSDKKQQQNLIIQPIDVTDFHKLYAFQYALFQLNFQKLSLKILSQANQQFLHQFVLFLKDFRFSTKIRQLSFKIINNIKNFKENQKILNYSFNSDQNEDKIIQILNCLNGDQIVNSCIAQLNQGEKEGIAYVFSLLKDKQVIKDLKPTDYLIILSKAIELNSTKIGINEIEEICSTAAEFLKINKEKCENFSQTPKNVALVTQYLFQQCLRQQLKQPYLCIFICALNNAVILRIFTYDKFYDYYEQITEISLSFSNKIKVLLNFNTNFRYLLWQCEEQQQYKKNYCKLLVKNNTIIQKFKLILSSNTQIKLLKAVIDFKQSICISEINDAEILPMINYQHEFIVDIKLWLNVKNIKESNAYYGDCFQIIGQLLAQKQCYSSYHFLYAHYLLITYQFQARRMNNVSFLLEKYEKIQVRQRNRLMDLFKMVLQLHQSAYDWKSIRSFVQNVRQNASTAKNYFVCFYEKQEMQRIIMYIDANHQQKITQRFQVYKIFLNLIQRYNQFAWNKKTGALLEKMRKTIFWELYFQQKLPHFSTKNLTFQQRRQVYINEYNLFKTFNRLNHSKYYLKSKLRVIMILSLIQIFLKRKKQALNLCYILLKIVRVINKAQFIFDFLEFFFSNILIFIHPQQEEVFRDFYLLHLQTIEKYKWQRLYLSKPQLIIPILQILYKGDIQKLINFVSVLTDQLRLHNSITSSRHMISILSKLCEQTKYKQFHKINLLLSQRLSLKENPYFIIWLYITQMYSSNPINSFMIQFCKTAMLLNLQIRYIIYRFILICYLKENYMKITKRKSIFLLLTIIKYKLIKLTKLQILSLHKAMFNLKIGESGHSQKYFQLSNKMISQSGILQLQNPPQDKYLYGFLLSLTKALHKQNQK